MAKRILIFSLAYYPKHIGGAEVAIKEITDRINPEDIQFDIVCLRFDSSLPKEEKIGNVFIHRIGFVKDNPTMAELKKFPLNINKIWFQFLAPIKARKLHKEKKYNAIWAMMAHSSGVPAAIFKIFNPEVPYLLTLQEGDPLDYIKKKMLPLWPLFKRAFAKADFVQAISSFLGAFSRHMGFSGPLEIIPNAVDVKKFSKEIPEEELSNLKNKLGKSFGDVFLITASRLVTKNGLGNVIESLTFLPKNVKFLILGDGPLEKSLKLQVASYKLQNRVIFLGQVAHEKLPKYLKISDIFVRPSLSEGMGNSFIEAMAAGVPVIATQEGGIADFLFDPDKNPDKEPTGLAVSPRDPEGIAQAVERYMNDLALKARIIENGRKMVFKKYDWDIIARDMKEKVFDRLLTNI